MARMLPKSVSAHTRSGAEHRLFERIREELPDDWIVLHSLGLTVHDRKPWAEIDFVLIGPPGVFCLEVKGGLITREDGTWYTTPQGGDDAGRKSPLKESPFEQAGSAAAELYGWLERQVPDIQRSVTGYAVAAPDVEWTVNGPDVDRALVYDQVDALKPFGTFMERVARRWNERVGRGWNRDLEPLGRKTKQRVVDAIRADFRLVPSLHAEAESAARELIRLTDEQADLFARLATNPRVISHGGAGTGKTVLAAAEARRLADDGNTVLFTCFSRNLAKYVGYALQDADGVTVLPLHTLINEVIDVAGRRDQLPDASDSDLYQLFLPELCLEILLEDPIERFDSVVVDEGQDLLLEPYVDVIDALLPGGLDEGLWRLFLDPNQNVFTGVAQKGMARLLAANPVDWPLAVNCRNTAPIATQVAILSDTAPVVTLAPDGPDVDYTWWSDRAQQREAIWRQIGSLLHKGFAAEQITVLSPHRLENSGLVDVSDRTKVPLVDLSRGGWDPGVKGLRFSTIASFKGLESDVVVLIDLEDLSPESQSLIYVGASRARVLLEVFLPDTARRSFGELAKRFGERSGDQPSS